MRTAVRGGGLELDGQKYSGAFYPGSVSPQADSLTREAHQSWL